MAPNSQKLGAVVWCNHGHRARWAEEASVVVGSSAVGINSAIGHGANSSALSLLVPGSPTDCVMARHYAPSDHLWPFVRLWAARRWLASWCRYEKNCAAIMRSSQDEFFVGKGRTNSGIWTVYYYNMLCGCVVGWWRRIDKIYSETTIIGRVAETMFFKILGERNPTKTS